MPAPTATTAPRSAPVRPAAFGALSTLLALLAGLLLPASADAATRPSSLEVAELEVVRLHNVARASAGLPPLDVHVDLHVDARRWSGEMAARQQLQHQTTSSGSDPYWETSCGVADPQWTACAENVARGPVSAERVHDAWMASSAHRANILDPRVNRVGIGVWSDGEDLWWTARFMAGTTADTLDSTPHPQDGTFGVTYDPASYDPDGPAGTVYRLYRAYFLREPDAAGFEFWLDRYRAGQSLTSISDEFVRSAEFRGTYGSLGDRDFVALVYANVLGRTPDLDGYRYWISQLVGGMTRGALMVSFSDSDEFRSKTADGVPPGYVV